MESEAALAELMGRMRTLEADHTPDGWPAVQMRDITALCDAIVARSETGALHLLARVREALGDNGTRMQGELVDYCRELAALPGHVAELEAQTPSALKAKLESAEARIAELERLVPDLSLLADEMDESGKKILRWVEGHAIPPGLNLHAHALRLSSLAAFLRR